MNQIETIVGELDEPLRVDKYIAEVLHLFTRSQIGHRNVRVWINDSAVKLSRRVRNGDSLRIAHTDPESPDIRAEKIPLDIVYEDADVIVVNKAQGMVVHPAAGNFSGTLVQGLLYHCAALQENFPDQTIRPGIVHRLDKDTSGLLIAAKNPHALEYLAEQFRRKSNEKRYLAVVKGRFGTASGCIETQLGRDPKNRKKFAVCRTGGKPSLSLYRCIRCSDNYSLMALYPRTGRTHQLRVHMAHTGHPIMGDPLYSRRDSSYQDGLLLQAYFLKIRLPGDGAEKTFSIPPHPRFAPFLEPEDVKKLYTNLF